MNDSQPENVVPKSHKTEIIIALIGLVGVLLTGVLSNWNRIFSDEQILEATYSGYRPTQNFETDLRYYLEVSGARKAIESTQKQLIEAFRIQLVRENPEDAELIDSILEIAREEAIKMEEVIQLILPVYKKHISLDELQELNKFYSTKTMQSLVNKLPLITQDATPLQAELILNFQKRYIARINELLEGRKKEGVRSRITNPFLSLQ